MDVAFTGLYISGALFFSFCLPNMVCPSVRGCLLRHSCWRGSGVLQLAFAQTGVMLQMASSKALQTWGPSTPGLAVCANLSWPAIPAASKQTSKSRALQTFAKKTQTGLLMRGAGVIGKTCFQLAFSARPQGCGLVWAAVIHAHGRAICEICAICDMGRARYARAKTKKAQAAKMRLPSAAPRLGQDRQLPGGQRRGGARGVPTSLQSAGWALA